MPFYDPVIGFIEGNRHFTLTGGLIGKQTSKTMDLK